MTGPGNGGAGRSPVPGRGRGTGHDRGVSTAPATVEELRAVGVAAGLDAVGIARAEPFESTRHTIERRKAAGLDAGMAFTYKNPARSTSPQLLLRQARSIVVGARTYHRDEPRAPAPDRKSTRLNSSH